MDIKHHFGGGSYAKETLIKAGELLTQHSHPHDHLSILARGTAKVSVDGVSTFYEGPTCIHVPAHKAHAVEAVTDLVWFCIWATDDTDPETVDTSILSGG